ncbi:hypothetical protein C7293_13815 [filamentous cyanobacterium CCT1]|nr:hypothetical protein C7293_13815 [filamentous cyanobacterium CCT1]
MAEIHRAKRDYAYGEVWSGSCQAVDDLFESTNKELAPVFNRVRGQRQRLVTSALSQVPMGQVIADRMAQKGQLSTDWVDEFSRRSACIVGESGDGKTHTLLWRLAEFIKANPQGQLHVCDIDYGSGHGDGSNTWLGLPLESVVHTEDGEILETVLAVSDEVSQRAHETKLAIAAGEPKPEYQPILLLIDEWVVTAEMWTKAERETALSALKNIVHRGLKQGVQCVLGMHSLAVNQSYIPKGLVQHLEVLFLWRAAQNTDNFSNLPISPSAAQDVTEAFKGYPRELGGVRSAIAFLNRELTIKGIPHLNVDVELVPDDAGAAAWAEQFRAAIVAANGSMSATKAWEKIAGQKAYQRKAENAEWIAFRDLVNSVNDALKEGAPPDGELNERLATSEAPPSL